MRCDNQPQFLEPIADEIVDKRLILYPNHNIYTHLGCALFRCSIGVALLNPHITNKKRSTIMFIMFTVLLLFGFKYLFVVCANDIVLWKSYPRMLLAYAIALYLVVSRREQYAGLIIIADALMGIQARHTSSALTCGLKKM